ncbi:MAG: site-specific DNA-methyltransferase [Planctomycetota bacterium]|nr:site-specific DNA-methyltransferase [Planctomycetota bacterium]
MKMHRTIPLLDAKERENRMIAPGKEKAGTVRAWKPDHAALKEAFALGESLERQYRSKFRTEIALNRALVSFQANKSRPVYRWYKYKEAFSAGLVEFLLGGYREKVGVLLDPFAGSGTALFAAASLGWDAEGIELLPVGQKIIAVRRLIEEGLSEKDIRDLARWAETFPWAKEKECLAIPDLRITSGAYPAETADAMGRFLAAAGRERPAVASILKFALLCILEAISYTRKDGQYLRWDYRAGKHRGKRIFDKGPIQPFDRAMGAKLREIVSDLRAGDSSSGLFPEAGRRGKVALHCGSCLDILPELASESFDCILTSPPYCNRYDYTRTYALELALLGINEDGLKTLRQAMLSCTVENRAKDLLGINPAWSEALEAAERQDLLRATLSYLESCREKGTLNNNGIPKMVRSYFQEMACVIFECARVLRNGARLMMVNDNVRYAGLAIPVDMILSEIARRLGFEVESILVLPNAKGNSSQQMGTHGCEILRKCVYVWKKE